MKGWGKKLGGERHLGISSCIQQYLLIAYCTRGWDIKVKKVDKVLDLM